MYATRSDHGSLVRLRFIFSNIVTLRRQQVAPMGLNWGLGTYICSQKVTLRNLILNVPVFIQKPRLKSFKAPKNMVTQ